MMGMSSAQFETVLHPVFQVGAMVIIGAGKLSNQWWQCSSFCVYCGH
jgi:hypothetical protein